MKNGNYLNIEELSNGNLHIFLTETGKEYLQDRITEHGTQKWIWDELIEDFSCNGSYTHVYPEQTGDLTDAPIILNYLDLDEDGVIQDHAENKKWYYAKYMIIDELDELLTNGEVIFTAA